MEAISPDVKRRWALNQPPIVPEHMVSSKLIEIVTPNDHPSVYGWVRWMETYNTVPLKRYVFYLGGIVYPTFSMTCEEAVFHPEAFRYISGFVLNQLGVTTLKGIYCVTMGEFWNPIVFLKPPD